MKFVSGSQRDSLTHILCFPNPVFSSPEGNASDATLPLTLDQAKF